MTKVTSGGLASHGMYQIVPEVHAEIVTRRHEKIAGDRATQEKRAAREETTEFNRQAARNKRRITTRSSMNKEDMLKISGDLKQQGDSPLKKNRAETEAQLQRRELRAANKRESNGEALHHVDIRVLLVELETMGDENEEALLTKSLEELVAELARRRNRNATNL
jgi:hypothetical protein